MIRTALLVGTCLTLMPAAAIAQTSPAASKSAVATPTVGATVLDSDGVAIGTIASITPQAIVLDMDGTKIAVPPTSVGGTAKGLQMAMTKAALQAAQAQQQAQAKAALQARLVPGTSVVGINGAAIGTIKAADASFVTLSTDKGEVKLPPNGFTLSPAGQIMLGMTEAQFDAAVAGGAGTAGAAGGTMTTNDAAATSTSTGISGTAGATGTQTMEPPATPATTTAPAPKPMPSTKPR